MLKRSKKIMIQYARYNWLNEVQQNKKCITSYGEWQGNKDTR